MLVGNYREALRHATMADTENSAELLPADEYPLRNLRPRGAIAVVESMADREQIVMINEAHHVPQHRTK